MLDPPLVTIVTPTLNAGAHLVEAIESVLSQDYPRIEYIVMDGGSTDNTSEILERYRGRLRACTGNDAGAADAINRGLRLGAGEICAWLSGDDTFLPGAVSAAVAMFTTDPALGVVYGDGRWTTGDGSLIGRYPTSPQAIQDLWRECTICQPAAFVRRSALEQVGFIDQRLQSAFDYDLWIRLSKVVRFGYLERCLATSRMHASNKTFSQRRTGLQEAIVLQRRHYGYAPLQSVYSYCAYRVDGRDQFFQPLRRSVLAFGLSLPYGVAVNRGMRRRFLREWTAWITLRGLRGLIGGYGEPDEASPHNRGGAS